MLTACGAGQNGSGSNNYDPNVKDINFNSGKDGLVFEFLRNSPPDQVREDSEFPVGLLISNKGAFSINTSKPALITWEFDEFYFNGTKSIQTLNSLAADWQKITLEGKSPIFPKGDSIYHYLPRLTAKTIKGQKESPGTELYVAICYPYRTVLSDEVCIDTYTIDDIRTKACEVQDKTYSSGQGSPVAITELHYELINFGQYLKPVFFMTVSNVGKGSVVSPDQDCGYAQSTNRALWDTVNIKATLGGEELTCRSANDPYAFRFKDNEIHLLCEYNQGYNQNLNYLTNLDVQIDFNYINILSQDVEIIRTWDGHYFGNISKIQNCKPYEYPVGNGCVSKCEACSKGYLECGDAFKESDWSCIDNTTLINGDTSIGTISFSDCITETNYCADSFVCCSKCDKVSYCGSYDGEIDCSANVCSVKTSDCHWTTSGKDRCNACPEKNTNKCMVYDNEDSCEKDSCGFPSECIWFDPGLGKGACYSCSGTDEAKDYVIEGICETDPCEVVEAKTYWSKDQTQCFDCSEVKKILSPPVITYDYSRSECDDNPCEFTGSRFWSLDHSKCLDCSMGIDYYSFEECDDNPCNFNPPSDHYWSYSSDICTVCGTTCSSYGSDEDSCSNDSCKFRSCAFNSTSNNCYENV